MPASGVTLIPTTIRRHGADRSANQGPPMTLANMREPTFDR
jgi:hypothetical protein